MNLSPVTRHHVAAVNDALGVATPWNPDVSGAVTAIAPTAAAVYIGGAFAGANSVNGTLTRNHLAAIDPGNGTATAWDPTRTTRCRHSPRPARPSSPAAPSPPSAASRGATPPR